MDNIVGKRVVTLRMHTVYHVEGAGNVPATITPAWRKDLTMTKTETGVQCVLRSSPSHLPSAVFFIPDTNCMGMTFDANDFSPVPTITKK